MRLTKKVLQQIIQEELSAVRMENLIKEITKRKFCQLMGLAGGALASGCGIDYELLNTKDNNEAGKPIPSCIQDPDIEPNLSDNSTWAGTPIKLYDFLAQPAFGKDDVYVSDDGEKIEVMILNVPSTADIWNSQAAIIQNSSPSWSEDDIINVYEVGGQPRHLVTIKIKFPIYTGEDGEEYVKHWSDGGNWGNIPQKNTEGCGLQVEEWLNPSKSLHETIEQEGLMYEGDASILEMFEGATLEEGDLVCEGCLFEMLQEASCGCPDLMGEAEYQGRKVSLNKPTRGDVKKFKVYVKDPTTGNVKKVNFGHGGTSAKAKGEKTMKIRKNNPKARKSFRARHNCSSPGPKTKARYWSCKKW